MLLIEHLARECLSGWGSTRGIVARGKQLERLFDYLLRRMETTVLHLPIEDLLGLWAQMNSHSPLSPLPAFLVP